MLTPLNHTVLFLQNYRYFKVNYDERFHLVLLTIEERYTVNYLLAVKSANFVWKYNTKSQKLEKLYLRYREYLHNPINYTLLFPQYHKYFKDDYEERFHLRLLTIDEIYAVK